MSRPAHSDASAAGLRYVSPNTPGIERRRAGRGFRYLDPSGRPVRDAATLARIRAIVIPPAWTDVWICTDADGHIQATGRDARGRRQYRYHPRYRARRDRDKFRRLVRFGRALPRIRRAVRRDLALRGLPREKVLAAVVRLLATTSFRVGNAEYARLNRSFGLSTLLARHARVTGGSIRFRFRGKGGRTEERTLVDRGLAALIRRCQDLPGQALFGYLDEEGEERGVSSEDVNDYIRAVAGSDEFSAKDFRTWVATVLAHRALRDAATEPGMPRDDRVRAAVREAAKQLNDSVAVTRNSYVHPAVLAAEPTAGETARRRSAAKPGDRPISRRDELDVLATLERSAGTPVAGTARRSQVDAGVDGARKRTRRG